MASSSPPVPPVADAKMSGFCLSKVVRANIQKLKPYRCARDDYSKGQLMDANENSLGPPLSLEPSGLERYPCPHQVELKNLYAKWRGVKIENIFLGVGSDEAIDLIIRMVCVPGKDYMLTLPPTYGMYKVCANINDIGVLEVPLNSDFMAEPAKIIAAVKAQPKERPVKIIFVCNPNNPTGNDCATLAQLEAVAAAVGNAIVVADEAYVDFSGRPSACSLVPRVPNLLVLQTFSKSWGMAGIRCGVAVGHASIVDYLNKMKAPYNLNQMTSIAARKALQCIPKLMANIKLIVDERERVAGVLRGVPGVKRVWPSDSNFLMFRLSHAHKVYLKMATTGVVIRFRGTATNCENCLRVSIGSAKENAVFLDLFKTTFAAICAEHAATG